MSNLMDFAILAILALTLLQVLGAPVFVMIFVIVITLAIILIEGMR
jgi:hypothetical protein